MHAYMVGQKETVNQIFYNNYSNIQAVTYVILQSIATSLIMQLPVVIEMHIAHDYIHYAFSALTLLGVRKSIWPEKN